MAEEVILFCTAPRNTLVGDAFDQEKGLQVKKIPFNFQVVRVQGRVRWKDHGSGDARAALILKRGTLKPKQILGRLDLAKYARGSTADEFTTAEFDFDMSNNQSPDQLDSFWKEGAAGAVVYVSLTFRKGFACMCLRVRVWLFCNALSFFLSVISFFR